MKILRSTAVLVVFMCGLGAVASTAALGHGYFAYKTPITATAENSTFAAGEAIISCKKVELTFTGELGHSAFIPLAPLYKECQVLGSEASIKPEKKAQVELETPVEEIKREEFILPTALNGEAGANIKIITTIEGEKCEITIPKQTFAGNTTRFSNTGTESGEVHLKMEGMHFTSNGRCAGIVPKEGNNLEYQGNAAEKGLIAE